MVLLRFVSLFILTELALILVANYAPFLAVPIYILSIVVLIVLVAYLIYHYSKNIFGRKK